MAASSGNFVGDISTQHLAHEPWVWITPLLDFPEIHKVKMKLPVKVRKQITTMALGPSLGKESANTKLM